MSSYYTPLETLKPSVASIHRAEEKERADRLHATDNSSTLNAFKVAELFKESQTTPNPTVSHNKGTNKYLDSLEERERSRRLADEEELINSQLTSMAVSMMVTGAHSHLGHQGLSKFTLSLEETERQRRIDDVLEATSRKARALRLSEGIRVHGSTIRARLISHRSVSSIAVEKVVAVATAAYDALPTSEQVSVVAHKAYDTLPSKTEVLNVAHKTVDTVSSAAEKAFITVHDAMPTTAEVKHAAEKAASTTNVMAHAVVDVASVQAAHAVSATKGVLSSIKGAVNSAVHSVQHAVYGDEEIHGNFSDFVMLEEHERSRRITCDRDGISRANGRAVSRLLIHAKFPTLKGSFGFKKYTRSIEERERTRRLANKDEAFLRELKAEKVSSLLTMLGWPLIRSAKFVGNRQWSEVQLLEEAERTRRMNDDYGSFTARYNARRIAHIMIWASSIDRSVLAQHLKRLEKRECAFRTKNALVLKEHARQESLLIENLGWPFYVGHTSKSVLQAALHHLEEVQEQKLHAQQKQARRAARAKAAKLVNSQQTWVSSTKQDRQLSQERTHNIMQFVSQDLAVLEETERRSRLADKQIQLMARTNANKVSSMIRAHQKKLTTQEVVIDILPATTLPAATLAPKLAPTLPTAIPTAPVLAHAPLVAPAPVAAPVAPAPVAAPVAPAPVVAPVVAPKLAPVVAAPVVSRPAAVATPATVVAPQTFAFTPLAKSDPKLIDAARKMQEKELLLAEKETQKMNNLSGKTGKFAHFRATRHQHSANKHLAIAQRHQEWINSQPTALPAPVSLTSGRPAL